MSRIIICTTNDISTDNRVNKVALMLKEIGYDVLWVGRVLSHSSPLERSYSTRRMRLFFNKGALFYAEFNIRLFFFLLTNRTDVILSNDLDTLLASWLVSRLRRKKLVYDTHEYFLGVPEIQDNPLAKKVWTFIERRIFPRLEHIFTVNQSIADLYKADYGKPVKVFRNISPIPALSKLKTRAELGLPENKYIIINQGSGINVDRGMEEMLEALAHIDNALLLLVGSGDVIPSLKREVEKRNWQDKVCFVDRVPYDQLLQYTRNADLGISLDKDSNINYKFSLPNKLFDYIHCGIPVVCSRVVEVSSIVKGYDLGRVVPSYKPEDIAEAINEVRFLGKNRFRKNLEIASKELTWENERKPVEEVYRSLQ